MTVDGRGSTRRRVAPLPRWSADSRARSDGSGARPRPVARDRIVNRGGREEAERGSVSLIGLALCVLVVIAALASVDVSAVVIGRARAQTAADLAALAAVTPYPVLPFSAEEPGSADRQSTGGGTSPTDGGTSPTGGGTSPSGGEGSPTDDGTSPAGGGSPPTGARGAVAMSQVNLDLPRSNGLGSPMERAATVAVANGGRVVSCSCGPLTATVAVAVRVPLVPFNASVEVRAYARAVLGRAAGPGESRVP
jgi:Putative Flp pilus-assembly TadE/G-like